MFHVGSARIYEHLTIVNLAEDDLWASRNELYNDVGGCKSDPRAFTLVEHLEDTRVALGHKLCHLFRIGTLHDGCQG